VIVDTSALIAVLRGEDDAERLIAAMAASDDVRMSAASWLEAAIVVDANADPVLSGRLDDLVAASGIALEPVTADQARAARQAYRDFGKGKHPAGLNFGDCFAYALARTRGEPLLYKGQGFALTDIGSALG
jgi:ribonuclease VapC